MYIPWCNFSLMQSTSTRFHVVFKNHSNSSILTMNQAVQVEASAAMLTNLLSTSPHPPYPPPTPPCRLAVVGAPGGAHPDPKPVRRFVFTDPSRLAPRCPPLLAAEGGKEAALSAPSSDAVDATRGERGRGAPPRTGDCPAEYSPGCCAVAYR